MTALEGHLRTEGHASGTYSYGSPDADREHVTVTLEDGKLRHQRRDRAVLGEVA